MITLIITHRRNNEIKMQSKLESSAPELILVDAQVIYPGFNIKITLASPQRRPLQIDEDFKTCDLMINSSHEKQKAESQKSLESLMESLNLQISELAKHQPPQIVAATYARLLQSVSWNGALFTKSKDKLQLINVEVNSGTSKRHHKQFFNYTFSSTNKNIDRDMVQIDYTPSDSWWYYSHLHPIHLSDVPPDFLLWFDMDKQDRGDNDDYPLVARALNVNNGYRRLALFYQIKFEIADVICCPPFYNQLPKNLPGNIFERQVDLNKSLTGLMIKYYYLHSCTRPDVKSIYFAGVKNRLPNSSWNGKWVSDHN